MLLFYLSSSSRNQCGALYRWNAVVVCLSPSDRVGTRKLNVNDDCRRNCQCGTVKVLDSITTVTFILKLFQAFNDFTVENIPCFHVLDI